MGYVRDVIPAHVRSLPAAIRRVVEKQCDGDWSRVVVNDDGTVDIANHVVMRRTELPPGPVPRRRNYGS
jgi:hypothetical protein